MANTTILSFDVYQGDHEDGTDALNKYVGSFTTHVPRKPIGEAKVNFTLNVDAHGLITATALNLHYFNRSRRELGREFGLQAEFMPL